MQPLGECDKLLMRSSAAFDANHKTYFEVL